MGIPDLLVAKADSIHLEGTRREDLQKIKYIIPRYNDLTKTIESNIWKCGKSRPEIIENTPISLSTILNPINKH